MVLTTTTPGLRISYMKRTVSLKLATTSEQSEALQALAEQFAAACNMIAPIAQEQRCWNRVALHHMVYYKIREVFPDLGSQMVCQAVHRVADAYKTLHGNGGIRKDKPLPDVSFDDKSVNFDKRTYAIKGLEASLFTLNGRVKTKLLYGQFQKTLLESGEAKEARLVLRKGNWYFNLCLDIPNAKPITTGEVLGVDVGENNLAATSTGKILGGGELRHKRDKYLAHRRRLQANGSRAAKRKLRKISGREQRHVKHVNHVVSKSIVLEAVKHGVSEIRMEYLTNIRANIKAGIKVRTRLHRWAFRQLQDFIKYKAEVVGMQVIFVNPAYTSKTCCVCGNIGKRERHSFSCLCGAKRHSDVNASVNIARLAVPIGTARGAVNRPKFAHRKSTSDVVESPRL